MPSAHEPVHPARQARAWLRAAARWLWPGFDRLSAAGWAWSGQKGQKRPFLAFSNGKGSTGADGLWSYARTRRYFRAWG